MNINICHDKILQLRTFKTQIIITLDNPPEKHLTLSLWSWFSPKKSRDECLREIIFSDVFVPRVSNNEKYDFMLNYLVP